MKTLKEINRTIEEAQSLLRGAAKELEGMAGELTKSVESLLPKSVSLVTRKVSGRKYALKTRTGRLTTREENAEAKAVIEEALSKNENRSRLARKLGISGSIIWRLTHPDAPNANKRGIRYGAYKRIMKRSKTGNYDRKEVSPVFMATEEETREASAFLNNLQQSRNLSMNATAALVPAISPNTVISLMRLDRPRVKRGVYRLVMELKEKLPNGEIQIKQ